MNKYILDYDDCFGKYVKIKTGSSQEEHIYKVVGRLKSNFYLDTPIMPKAEPKHHNDITEILNVIHCGIAEDTVLRVALSECEFIEPCKNFSDKDKETICSMPLDESCFSLPEVKDEECTRIINNELIGWMEELRLKYLATKNEDYFKALVTFLPKSYKGVEW